MTDAYTVTPPVIRWRDEILDAVPEAAAVKDVMGWIDIGAYRVAYENRWGDDRFPWKLRGEDKGDDERTEIESYPRYREAVRAALRLAKDDDFQLRSKIANFHAARRQYVPKNRRRRSK